MTARLAMTVATAAAIASSASAMAATVAVLGCSNWRTTSGEKLVREDCAQSIEAKRSPACQSRSPVKSNPEPWDRLL